MLLLLTGFITLQASIAQPQEDTTVVDTTTDDLALLAESLVRQRVTPAPKAEEELALYEKIESGFERAVDEIAGV